MKLIIEDDDGRRTVVPFAQDEVSIGREPGNVVRLTERNVSRHHALMMRDEDSVVVEDLGSSNGVRVNGDLITGPTRIRHGDHVRIGDYDLALDDESKPEVAERPTQPDLSALPDTIVAKASGGESPFAGIAAVARFKKAAAIQALLAKGDVAGAKPPGTPTAETWPRDFHFVAPGTVDRMKASEARRKRTILGAVTGSGLLLAVILAFGLFGRAGPSRAPAVAPTPVGAPAPPVAPAPAVAPAPPPEPLDKTALAPAGGNGNSSADTQASVPAALPPIQAASPEFHPTPASAKRPAPSEGPRRKALNLYQDAVADVANDDYPSALSKLLASAELNPSSPEIQKELAICYSHLRQPDKGASHYEQYLKLRPDAPDAADVRKMLSDYHASKGAE